MIVSMSVCLGCQLYVAVPAEIKCQHQRVQDIFIAIVGKGENQRRKGNPAAVFLFEFPPDIDRAISLGAAPQNILHHSAGRNVNRCDKAVVLSFQAECLGDSGPSQAIFELLIRVDGNNSKLWQEFRKLLGAEFSFVRETPVLLDVPPVR